MALLSGGVFIAGLGGLGGWLLEHMLRLGPEFVRAADGDVFDESNLDRQLISAPTLIGRSKAAAAKERAELVHGAVGGWFFQAGTVPPGSGMLERLYPGGREPEHSRTHSQVVSACAAVQAAEAERLLSGEKPRLWGRLLMADLDSMSVHTVSFCTL